MARFNAVHASGYNSAGSVRIRMKLWAPEYIVWSWPWQILGAIRAEARAGEWAKFLFFCQVNNARLCRFPVSQISRNLHTRRGSMSPWILSENIYENLPERGLFSKNVNFCLNIVNAFRLQSTISPKWIQIAESHDRLACLRNVGIPYVSFESTKITPRACRARTRSALSNATSRVIYILKI